MPGTPATAALRAAGLRFVEHSYVHDPRAEGFGREAAEALGVAADRVLKTLVVLVDTEFVVGLIPVSATLDLKLLAAAVGGKHATMADAGVAERRTGYVRGGISPLGQRRRHRTVVDESALHRDTVFVSGGRRGLELELDPTGLIRVTGATVAVVARRDATAPPRSPGADGGPEALM